MSVSTKIGSGALDLPFPRPVAGSVAGSPFTTSGTSQFTPELTGLYMVNVVGNPIHARFDGQPATANDMQIPVGIQHFPCSGKPMAMIQQTGAATVYVERCAEDGVD